MRAVAPASRRSWSALRGWSSRTTRWRMRFACSCPGSRRRSARWSRHSAGCCGCSSERSSTPGPASARRCGRSSFSTSRWNGYRCAGMHGAGCCSVCAPYGSGRSTSSSSRCSVHDRYVTAPFCALMLALTGSSLPARLLRVLLSLLSAIITLRLTFDLRKRVTTERVLLALGLMPLGLTIMWVVSKRFRLARAEALQLQESLAQRVQQKESELRESFERLSQLERARAVTAERERILRDMHDGVGANLATAMRQLESGTAPA